jgi:hypothetical protein
MACPNGASPVREPRPMRCAPRRRVVGEDARKGGRLPVASRLARVNELTPAWPFVSGYSLLPAAGTKPMTARRIALRTRVLIGRSDRSGWGEGVARATGLRSISQLKNYLILAAKERGIKRPICTSFFQAVLPSVALSSKLPDTTADLSENILRTKLSA